MYLKTIKMLCVMMVALLPLSACGEGWVAQKTTAYFPYGNERTAGSGIVYVRAKLLPEKQLNLPEAKTETEVVKKIVATQNATSMNEVRAPSEVEAADKLFKKVQRK